MSPPDRRMFLKTAAAGLATVASARSAAPSSDGDPLGVRADFPVTRDQTYLNTAYAGPTPTVVREAAREFADEKMLRPSPGRRKEIKEQARAGFADLFGAKTEEVALLYSTSDGENIVARGLDLRPGDNVVVDELHFTTSFVLFRQIEKEKGIELRIVPQRNGRARIEDFDSRVNGQTRLVSVAWVSNVNGYRHDLRALAELSHSRGALLYTDAIQALGTFPTSLTGEGVDFAAGNAYKWLFATYGVAPFFIRQEHLDRIGPDRYGHAQVAESLPDFHFRLQATAEKFEYANLAYGPVQQLAAALPYIKKVGLSRIEEHSHTLARELRDKVAALGFQTLTPPGNSSPIVSFVHGKPPEVMANLLEEESVVVSLRAGGAQVRAAVAMFNNRSDIQRLIKVLEKVA